MGNTPFCGAFVAGLLGFFAASRALSSLLYGVDRSMPLLSPGTLVVLAAVALTACYLPARRASLVDPIEALRAEKASVAVACGG